MCCCFLCNSDDEQGRIQKKPNRSCTDVFALIVFIAFCGWLLYIAGIAFLQGDLHRIFYGSDSFGNTCGRDNAKVFAESNRPDLPFPLSGQDMTDKRYMFPLNPRKPFETLWACVSQCPTEYAPDGLDGYRFVGKHALCGSEEASRYFSPSSELKKYCPVLPMQPSTSIINRCLSEEMISLGVETVRTLMDKDFVRGYLNDVVASYSFVLLMCAVALGISIVLAMLLRFLAAILITFVYGLIIVVGLAISSGFWYAFYLAIKREESEGQLELTTTLSPHLHRAANISTAAFFESLSVDSFFDFKSCTSTTVMGLAIGASVITLFLVLAVWCLFPRGQKLAELFKLASKALGAMPILMVQPMFAAILLLIVSLYFFVVGSVLYTAGEMAVLNITTSFGIVETIEPKWTELMKIMAFCHFAGFIWWTEFVMACQRLFITGAISLWYFSEQGSGDARTDSSNWPVMSAFWNMLRYHLGSAAFGSLIITIVRLPRFILMYIYAKMKAVENVCMKRLLAIFICLLGCIEKCLRYINFSAYTVIAYSGASFCPAARTAVNTLLDNAVDVASANTVGRFVLFLTKLIVASTTAAISAFMLDEKLHLNHRWLPTALVFVCAYLIATCLLSTYDMAIDSLLICTAHDATRERNEADYYMSRTEFSPILTSSSSNRATRSGQSRTRDEQLPLNRL